jgi:amino acid adenylation domain-containing protein
LPEPDDKLLHHWLRRTSERQGASPAIIEDDRVITFSDLFEQAASLSHALTARGLSKGDRVALVLPKSTEAIASLFAVLMAGAIYVPIQPRWPAERIQTTMDDCAPRFVIKATDSGLVIADCANGEQLPWRDLLASSHPPCPEPAITTDDPAFILFTSGSTGNPKGVVISHRAVAAFVKWSAGEFQLGREDRIACPSPLSFDLSTFDIFNMALIGATCVLVPEQIVWMPRFLSQFVREQRITVWYSVPSILAGMLNEGWFARGSYPDLCLILFAGEVFAARNLAKLQAVVPHAQCVNLYGPTETNVITWYRVPSGFDPSLPIPIGKACPYAELAMDKASGALFARGKSVMSGYWNRPQETEQAFVTISGKRFYSTGDRVSLTDSSDYVFLDRLDRQVKRRGFRIELGEIEATLLRHAEVLEAAAIACQNPDGQTTITAFVRPRSPLSLLDIKTFCSQFLPSYSMPDRVLFVEAIPKGSRGKIDYAALKSLPAEERTDEHPGGCPPVHS